ncbi:hypothetical protein F503_03970 [Ophiostoma piceae UAMH 11346]|uniref:Uncharacterized protein n=1 Tax=Ophiostoma piceae (strain UAMH 11346) TaxID=1262450 RepID=S3CP66_OPHP1|nr:hypothetical protein F503_03970 [Ophiostoma piceae UAMH 11346]
MSAPIDNDKDISNISVHSGAQEDSELMLKKQQAQKDHQALQGARLNMLLSAVSTTYDRIQRKPESEAYDVNAENEQDEADIVLDGPVSDFWAQNAAE